MPNPVVMTGSRLGAGASEPAHMVSRVLGAHCPTPLLKVVASEAAPFVHLAGGPHPRCVPGPGFFFEGCRLKHM